MDEYCHYLYNFKNYRYTEFEETRIRQIIYETIEEGFRIMDKDEERGVCLLSISLRLLIAWSPGDVYFQSNDKNKLIKECSNQRIIGHIPLSNNRDVFEIYQFVNNHLEIINNNMDLIDELCKSIFDIHSITFNDLLYVYTQMIYEDFKKSMSNIFGMNTYKFTKHDGKIHYCEFCIYITDKLDLCNIFHPKIILTK